MNAASRPSPSPPIWRQPWFLALLLVGITLAAFGPAWGAGYIWDDDVYVTGNPLLAARDGLRRIWFSFDSPSQYFPLTYTTFYFERFIWGLNPAGYHMVNLFLHAANAVLLWRLLLRLNVRGAWLAAALFAIHPVQVESAAWITERKNVLMGLFFLLSIRSWLIFVELDRPKRWRPYFLSLVFFAFALFAKTTACTLPAVLILLLWLKKIRIDRQRLLQVLPFVLMGFAMGLVTIWWERHHQGTEGKLFSLPLISRFLVACHALWFYLGKLLWPFNLIFSYPHWAVSPANPLNYLWVAATAAAVGLIVWVRRWTGRGIEVGMLFFTITLAPLLGFIMLYTFIFSYVADHYQYLACIGPLALAAVGLEMAWRRVRWGRFILRPAFYILLLTGLSLLTWRQCRYYTSAETLWRATLEKNPDSWLAHNDLGNILFDSGQVDDAIDEYQAALKIDPNLGREHYNLGLAYIHQSRFDEGENEYVTALRLDPKLSEAHENYGLVLLKKGQLDQALAQFQTAEDLQPLIPGAEINIGLALERKKDYSGAAHHFEKGLALNPNDLEARNNYGRILVEAGRRQEAAAQFQKVLDTDPDHIDANNNLAWVLATSDNVSKADATRALTLARHAQELNKTPSIMILHTLAAASAATGNFGDAQVQAQTALDLAIIRKNNYMAGLLRDELKRYSVGQLAPPVLP